MATRSALGLMCLVAITATAYSAVETVYKKEGADWEIGEAADYDSTVESCVVHTNNGSDITLFPSSENSNKDKFRLKYNMCTTNVIKVTQSDSGKWKMTMALEGKETIVHEYNLNVRQEYRQKTAYPSSKIKVYANQLVSVHFNEIFDNLMHCKILTPQNAEYNLLSNESKNIKLYKSCGVKMEIPENDPDYTGKWTLIADLKNGTAFFTTFDVVVKNIGDLKPLDSTFVFKRGERGTITFGKTDGEDKSKVCILENPRGEKMPISSGPCNYVIAPVSEYHEGIWTAYYGLEGTETLVKQKIIVKTYTESTFNSSTSVSSNGDIHLLCQVRTRSMEYCTFERPDGLLLHMSEGVGNEKYEYYGNGKTGEPGFITSLRDVVYDCGITIHKPRSGDYGTWKCLIGVSEISEPVGTILKVVPPARSGVVIKSTSTSKDVYAKRGAQFKVKCSTNEPLSYCWLSSPNGTVHTVVMDKGYSFDLGNCTAVFENANDSDAGKWTCHMGVVNGPELETSFKVYLEETNLMADRNLVILEKNSQSDLICRPIPDSDRTIDSCRWVSPSGHGINIDPEGRYVTQTESTHCRLSFKVLNLEDDLGEWSCFARFTNLEEGSARMIVVYQSSSLATFLSVALVISLLSCVALGIFIFVLYKRRIAHRHVDEKIVLDEKPPKYP